MKSALLAQNDNLVIEKIKQNVGRSVFDLSHSTTFTIDVDGAILPVCCLETVPSDSFEISCECLLRQLSPLTVPLMANFRLNTAWFWCDNRLGWKKWDRFMTGGRSGNEVYDLPRVYNMSALYPSDSNSSDAVKKGLVDSAIDNDQYNTDVVPISKCLHTYFGISTNQKAEYKIYDGVGHWRCDNVFEDDLPLAFPFFDYQIICRDFYTDVDRLAQNPSNPTYRISEPFNDWSYSNLFPVDEDEFKLQDGLQEHSGYNTDDDSEHSSEFKGVYLDKVRYHNVRPDYFVSSKKAPMRGDAPSIALTAADFVLPSGSEIKIKDDNLITITSKDVISNNTFTDKTVSATIIGGTGPKVVGPAGDTHDTSKFKVDSQTIDSITGVTDGDITVTGNVTTEVTAADLLLVSQLTQWKILNMLHEPYYNDFLNAHFDNVRVGESEAEKPQYIGGTSQLININEILQTSQTTTGETGSPLGNQGAVAMSLANNYVGRYYCNNYGYLIGVAYIITDMYYEPAIPRWSSRRTKEDFYSPEFANLSMQATLNKEIFSSNDEEWNNTPWGYTGSFDELRSIPNRIAGDLLNDNYTDLKSWVIRREMSNENKPSMSTKWLSLKDNVDKTNIWTVPTMPAFMLQCANYIKAVRPMPKVAIPKAL